MLLAYLVSLVMAATFALVGFWSTMGFPVELLMGRLTPARTATGFAVGIAWLVGFGLLYRIGWRRGLRRYQAVAG